MSGGLSLTHLCQEVVDGFWREQRIVLHQLGIKYLEELLDDLIKVALLEGKLLRNIAPCFV